MGNADGLPEFRKRLFSRSSLGGREDFIRRNERYALRCADGRRERRQERSSQTLGLPADQHGVVLMNCVVAVLHKHAAPIAELHGDGYAAAWTQAIHVFAALFPGRNVSSATVAGQDLAFFKVDVNGVVPSAATVAEFPHLARAILRQSRDAAEARIERGPGIVCLDAPRPLLPA